MQDDFVIFEIIFGVNMWLMCGGICEMYWYQQVEWVIMFDGCCWIMVFDEFGWLLVQDVKIGDFWYFLFGLLYLLQGLGSDGVEFLFVFDNGCVLEFNMLLLIDWIVYMLFDVFVFNFGVLVDVFRNVLFDNLWIFQGDELGLFVDVQCVFVVLVGVLLYLFIFLFGDMKLVKKMCGGEVWIVDSINFNVLMIVVVVFVIVYLGGMCELYWYLNVDEWQYYLQGEVWMMVFDMGLKVQMVDFCVGDVGYVKKSFGYYVQNIGQIDFVFFEIFKIDCYVEVLLFDWFVYMLLKFVEVYLNVVLDVIVQFLCNCFDVVLL